MTYRLFLDTSSLMYRAFFSVPPTMRDARGGPVNAVHGYLEMITRLIGSRHPDECLHVYDHDWRPAPRVAVYAGYKANRLPDPEGLPGQFDLLRTILDALGMRQAEAPGWEAEDAIGAMCARQAPGDRADIVTGDRDLIQLVRDEDPSVRVLFTVRGVSDLRILDEAGVMAKYGVPASRYAEFAILRGDPSDGLPGVRGVGEKTARLLVGAYPDLEAMLRDAAAPRRTGAPLQRSASLRASLREAEDYMEAMNRVVPIKRDADVRTWGAGKGLDSARLMELAESHGVGGPVRRLQAALRDGK